MDGFWHQENFFDCQRFLSFGLKNSVISMQRPLLLIVDGHLTHLSVTLIEKVIKENVFIIRKLSERNIVSGFPTTRIYFVDNKNILKNDSIKSL